MADDDLLMTRADYEKLEREIEELETSARGEMAERIKAARELGDLKENAEYHDAKDAQAILETRILRLRDQLTRAQVVQAEGGGDAIAFGSEIEIADRDSGKRTTYTLVSAVDADAAAGRLSVESPVAQALVGARAGDVVEIRTPKGKRTLEVISIA
ncbi:MAG TPA: transcription elongation factor GreA [Solirubrobacteraceae bacterium]|nr:transcription elongation factor GreA [Solirubrobacteraceae bacterium]